MKRQLCWLVAGLAVSATCVAANAQTTLFQENFNALPLQSSVNERLTDPTQILTYVEDVETAPDTFAIPNSFSSTGPANWTVDNSISNINGAPTIGNAGVPGQGVVDYGVNEWEGWSFADKNFWIEAAGDQDRSLFTAGSNVVAVADADEYFDLGGTSDPVNGGFYNTGLNTPSVGMAQLGVVSAGVQLKFDSSFRTEAFDDGHPNVAFEDQNDQTAEVVATFDTGEVQSVTVYQSSNFANGTSFNELQELNFFPNTNATSVSFAFNMGNAGNDWWWAIDNVEVADIDLFTGVPLAPTFTENFDSVALGASQNERGSSIPAKITTASSTVGANAVPNAFTNVPPANWAVDNSGTDAATLGDNDEGVYEWEGWSFADRDFWLFADQQDRELFTKADGVLAIADGDEWTDLGDNRVDPLDTLLTTPSIDLTAVGPDGLVRVQFDYSWRPEPGQDAFVTATLSDGTIVNVLSLEGSEDINGDNVTIFGSGAISGLIVPDGDQVNASLDLLFDPGTATSMVLDFSYVGGNNWWFAVDNVNVTAVPEPATALMLGMALVGFAARRR